MVALTITHNFPQVQRLLDGLREDVAKKATASAINRTLAIAKTDMGREIRKEYNVSATYVRERLHIKRAAFKAGTLAMEGTLRGGDAKRRSANVIAFLEKFVTLSQMRRRQRKEGGRPQLRFKIKRSGGKQVITGAFVGNKGRTVFKRTGKKALPIEAVRTIDVPQMFNAKRINDAVTRAMVDKFPEVWAREVKFFTAKFGGTQ